MAKNGFEEEEKEEEDEEENIDGFVHKSKGFLLVNLPNPKGESFDAEGIEEGIKEGRSKVLGLKEKLVGRFSRGIILGFFNSSNRARVFGSFFPLVIYVQRGKLHLGPHGRIMRKERRKSLTYKAFSYKHGSWVILYAGGNYLH